MQTLYDRGQFAINARNYGDISGHDEKPTMEYAKTLPLKHAEMSNDTLLVMASIEKNFEARRELLIRHIMSVDSVEYDAAEDTCEEIDKKAKEGLFMSSVPSQAGLAMAGISGIVCVPMVFDLDTALWFNEHFVTADVAEDKDLETWLEVGGWTWNWMEPVLGTASFVLLAAQFARAQLHNLGLRPFTSWMRHRRGEKLVEAFPQYDKNLLIAYGKVFRYY